MDRVQGQGGDVTLGILHLFVRFPRQAKSKGSVQRHANPPDFEGHAARFLKIETLVDDFIHHILIAAFKADFHSETLTIYQFSAMGC